MMWLAEIPQAVVAAHLEMLPRLQAEEALAAVSVAALGRGPRPSNDLLRDWRRTADGGRRAPARKAVATDLQALGIGVRRA